MGKILGRPRILLDKKTHYCPGCGHGMLHRIVAQSLEDLGIADKTIAINSVGCSVFLHRYFRCDHVQAPHGRAPAIATAVKRAKPDWTVFTYQGDGDLAAIGTGEIVHAANRGENITVFFINNAIYGMTGGQLAPTTLPGQKTTTTPEGRDPKLTGMPIKMSEMLSILDGTSYIERVALDSVPNIIKTEQAVKKALTFQRDGLGFSLVEVLSPCPLNWHMQPIEAQKWVASEMMKFYPLRVYKDVTAK